MTPGPGMCYEHKQELGHPVIDCEKCQREQELQQRLFSAQNTQSEE